MYECTYVGRHVHMYTYIYSLSGSHSPLWKPRVCIVQGRLPTFEPVDVCCLFLPEFSRFFQRLFKDPFIIVIRIRPATILLRVKRTDMLIFKRCQGMNGTTVCEQGLWPDEYPGGTPCHPHANHIVAGWSGAQGVVNRGTSRPSTRSARSQIVLVVSTPSGTGIREVT